MHRGALDQSSLAGAAPGHEICPVTASTADPFHSGPYSRIPPALRLVRREPQWLKHRAVALALIAWLPLAILAATQGLALSDIRRESQLLDISAYVRYLVAIPAFVLAEAVCLPQLGKIVRQFLDAGLVPAEERPRYDAILASTRALLVKPHIEFLLLLLAYARESGDQRVALPVRGVHLGRSDQGRHPLSSLAGWWLLLVSQPLYQLLIAMWLYRVALWARLLWKLSRLDLRLLPSHPDRAGGLSFVATSLRGFAAVGFGLGVAVAGGVAEAVFVDGRPVTEFKVVVAALVVLVLVLFVGPLFVFTVPLRRARIHGIFAYGELASAVGQRFERRWLDRHGALDDDVLSVPDFLRDHRSLPGGRERRGHAAGAGQPVDSRPACDRDPAPVRADPARDPAAEGAARPGREAGAVVPGAKHSTRSSAAAV